MRSSSQSSNGMACVSKSDRRRLRQAGRVTLPGTALDRPGGMVFGIRELVGRAGQ